MPRKQDPNEPGAQPDLSHGLPGDAEGHPEEELPDFPSEINAEEELA